MLRDKILKMERDKDIKQQKKTRNKETKEKNLPR